MNYKKKYAILGAITGIVATIIIQIMDILIYQTGALTGNVFYLLLAFFCCIGVFMGFIVGIIRDDDIEAAKLLEEQEKKRLEEERKKQMLAKFEKNFQTKVKQIEGSIGKKVDIEALYKGLYALKEEVEANTELNECEKNDYFERFNGRLHQHKEQIEKWTSGNLSNVIRMSGLKISLENLKFLRALGRGDTGYDAAIMKLERVIKNIKEYTDFCSEVSYGEWLLPLDESEIQEMKNHINEYKANIINACNKIPNKGDGYFSDIAEYLPDDIVRQCAKLMWYYAKSVPFDVAGFKQAVELYDKFTTRYCKDENNEYFYHCKIEAILARIYAFHLMGGENAVEQEKDDVRGWVKDALWLKNRQECFLLASALCWMELYKFEKEILETLVRNGVQLTAELQERYGFLVEGGESSKAKVYDVEGSDTFMYDSSASEWSVKDFDMFFRKLSMKKKNINYSLAISKWKTTLPLVSGQKVSKEELHNEFMKLIDDYDGELTCRKVNSKAVNLSNIENEQAELFEFVGERNKCISILFIAEKYGRNLNLTILTLFTPAEDLSNEELKKYAMSIKDNMYVDSFIESIRQAVDEVIKEKQDIYGTSIDGSQEQDGAKEKIIKVFE